MKILFHISSIYGGGAERVLCNLANHFCDNDNDVTIVVCYEKDNEYFINEKINKIVLKKKNILAQSKELRKIIKEINPNISIGFMQGGNIRLTLASLFLKNKYILSVRNDPKREYSNFFSRLFAKSLFHLADGVVFQTEDAKNYFSKKIQKKSIIILNPVSNEFFIEPDFKTKKENIVSLGRLVEQKNYFYLIEAYSKIVNEIDDNLYIYGEGPLKNELQNYINSLKLNNRVFLVGRTANSQEVLRTAKVFVMSSKYEGLPNALLEAVVMGVPSIATDCPCGGPKIIFSEGEGVLVPLDDVDNFANELKNVLTNEKLQKKLTQICYDNRNKYKDANIFLEWCKFINDKGGQNEFN